MLNEKGEIVAWVCLPCGLDNVWCPQTDEFVQRLCQMKANAEMTELLTGIRRRHEALGLPMPEMMVTDNFCQVCRAVQFTLPETDCILDVWHCIARYDHYTFPLFRTAYKSREFTRYIAIIINSQRNMYQVAVAADITNVILRKHSVKGSGAEYWSKEEQEQKLEAAFAKWIEKRMVWSGAVMQVSLQLSSSSSLCTDPTMIRYTGNSSGMFARNALNVAIRTFYLMAAILKNPTRDGIHSSMPSQVESPTLLLLDMILSSVTTSVWVTVVYHKQLDAAHWDIPHLDTWFPSRWSCCCHCDTSQQYS